MRGGIHRRAFLQRLLTLSTLPWALSARSPFAHAAPCGNAGQETGTVADRRWQVLDAVHDHLLPAAGDGPGAREIRATAYLRWVVLEAPDTDPEEARWILQGARWLDELARARQGAGFVELDAAGREAVLRQTAASRAGDAWLSILLGYLMEALLVAPAYGANPGGRGWAWLAHQPGFPLPPPERTYPCLQGLR